MKAQIVTILWMMAVVVSAREARPWEQYLNEVMTLEDAESAAWEETYGLLCELEQHPLDINTVTRERLEELPFLSAQQIEGIMEYRWRHGPLRSLGELLMIRPLDYVQCRLLSYFVYAGEEKPGGFPHLKTVTRYGKQELIGSARVPCYERRGDRKGYQGAPLRHWLRYQLTYGDTLKAGLVGAQDAGEPFFAGRNRGGTIIIPITCN